MPEQALQASGLTVSGLARRLGCSEATIRDALRGGGRGSYYRVIDLASILGVSAWEFTAGGLPRTRKGAGRRRTTGPARREARA